MTIFPRNKRNKVELARCLCYSYLPCDEHKREIIEVNGERMFLVKTMPTVYVNSIDDVPQGGVGLQPIRNIS